jgi:hypothetical protein
LKIILSRLDQQPNDPVPAAQVPKMAQIASNIYYPQDCEMDTDHEPQQSADGNFSGMLQRLRSRLLNGPAILMTVSHSGTQAFDYAHQCVAAQGMVHYDRSRQLCEQAESNNRSFDIEFPAMR